MSLEKRSLLTGILYISLAFIGPVGFLILPEQFNLVDVNGFVLDNKVLVGAWLFVDLVIIVIEVIISIFLLKLFNTYNKNQSFVAFIFRMLMTAVMVVNATFLLIVLVSQDIDFSYYIELHNDGVYVWQLFFVVHLFFIGYMLFKNNPSMWKFLGIAVILGSLGYLVDSVINLGNIDNTVLATIAMILLVFVTIGELGMAIGLIMRRLIQ